MTLTEASCLRKEDENGIVMGKETSKRVRKDAVVRLVESECLNRTLHSGSNSVSATYQVSNIYDHPFSYL